MYIILHHGTLEILQLCHLGICVYAVEAHTGLIEYPYTPHIEEGERERDLFVVFVCFLIAPYQKD